MGIQIVENWVGATLEKAQKLSPLRVLNTERVYTPELFRPHPQVWQGSSPHFPGGKSEAGTGQVTCPESHSLEVAIPRFEQGAINSKPTCSCSYTHPPLHCTVQGFKEGGSRNPQKWRDVAGPRMESKAGRACSAEKWISSCSHCHEVRQNFPVIGQWPGINAFKKGLEPQMPT